MVTPMNESQNSHLMKGRQEQMLKLVARSFYKELSNYGVDSSDIVTVSLHLLDHVTQNGKTEKTSNGYYQKEFVIKDISTIANNPDNLTRWAETVNRVIDRHYK